ncbi:MULTISPECIES: hypothetical protein [unclassified Thiocapsa]|uniref:hypothetical protein n=1 Tax=unclassified Thiocapsa TaxID=2641286 RepID=UPI0035B23B5D
MNHVADYGSRFHVPPALIPHRQELEPETSNNKPPERDERVQLIDVTDLWTSVKNKGNKRRLISDVPHGVRVSHRGTLIGHY